MTSKDYMIKLGETANGRIIEIPDVFIWAIAIGFLVFLFTINIKKDEL